MDDAPRDTLRELLATDRSICDDPARCEALLRDLCSSHKREINALVTALKAGVASDLLKQSASTPAEMLVARLTARLSGDWALSADAAQWAVASWASALGVRLDDPSPRRIEGTAVAGRAAGKTNGNPGNGEPISAGRGEVPRNDVGRTETHRDEKTVGSASTNKSSPPSRSVPTSGQTSAGRADLFSVILGAAAWWFFGSSLLVVLIKTALEFFGGTLPQIWVYLVVGLNGVATASLAVRYLSVSRAPKQ